MLFSLNNIFVYLVELITINFSVRNEHKNPIDQCIVSLQNAIDVRVTSGMFQNINQVKSDFG